MSQNIDKELINYYKKNLIESINTGGDYTQKLENEKISPENTSNVNTNSTNLFHSDYPINKSSDNNLPPNFPTTPPIYVNDNGDLFWVLPGPPQTIWIITQPDGIIIKYYKVGKGYVEHQWGILNPMGYRDRDYINDRWQLPQDLIPMRDGTDILNDAINGRHPLYWRYNHDWNMPYQWDNPYRIPYHEY
jgi:hypothetical protein